MQKKKKFNNNSNNTGFYLEYLAVRQLYPLRTDFVTEMCGFRSCHILRKSPPGRGGEGDENALEHFPYTSSGTSKHICPVNYLPNVPAAP